MVVDKADKLIISIKPEIIISEEKYPEIFLDEDFSKYIKIFRMMLMWPFPKMFHEITRSVYKYFKNDLKDFLERTNKIIEIIGSDTYLASELGIDLLKLILALPMHGI